MIEQNIAAAYVRVSDARQDEYSPESQLKLIARRRSKTDIIYRMSTSTTMTASPADQPKAETASKK